MTTDRLAFIDWTRGLAAVVMLQGHTFHSFTRNDLRDKGPYVFSQFLGGLPPALFLFLTGITFAFLMNSKEKQGAGAWRRVVAALKRSRYLVHSGISVPHSAVRLRISHQPGERAMAGGHPQLHGYGDVALCADGGVFHAGADPVVYRFGPGDRGACAICEHDRRLKRALDRSRLLFPELELLRLLPLGGIPGLRNGCRQRDPHGEARRDEPDDALDDGVGRRPGVGGAVIFQPAVFGLPEERFLAE